MMTDLKQISLYLFYMTFYHLFGMVMNLQKTAGVCNSSTINKYTNLKLGEIAKEKCLGACSRICCHRSSRLGVTE